MLHQRRWYWYLKTVLDGRNVLIGCYATEEEAYEVGMQKLNNQFETVKYPTSNLEAATRMMKGGMVNDNTTPLRSAMRRVKHKV